MVLLKDLAIKNNQRSVRMKKTAIVILAFAMVLTAATGCENKETAKETSNVQSAVSQEQSSAAESSEKASVSSREASKAEQSSAKESSAAAQPKDGAKEMVLKFGSKEPFAYNTTVNDKEITIGLSYFGAANIYVLDEAEVGGSGGLEGLEETLSDDIRECLNTHLESYSKNEVSVTQLTMDTSKIEDSLTSLLNEAWNSQYGVGVKSIGIYSFNVSDEDKARMKQMLEESASGE